jgi:signal transduction histidine kinase
MGQGSSFSNQPVHAEVIDPATDDAIALACHKLRTPLTSAMGFLQLALRDARHETNTSKLRNLEMADQQLRRLAGLIDELALSAAGPEH